MIFCGLLFLLGLFLSAFFSGSETGFYRVTRLRLILDGREGDRIANCLLWLLNHPTFFVATTLVGNNLANYAVSLSLVLGVHVIWQEASFWAELIAPVVLAPVVFVYGELLPKYLFFHVPNRLLRLSSPLFFVFAVLFLPMSGLLWMLGQVVRWVAGESPQQVRTALARAELKNALHEGHVVGILQPVQYQLAQDLMALAQRPISTLAIPISRVYALRRDTRRDQALKFARWHRLDYLPLVDPKDSRAFVGYVRTVDLILSRADGLEPLRALPKLRGQDPGISALLQLHDTESDMAMVTNATGEVTGMITAEQLKLTNL